MRILTVRRGFLADHSSTSYEFLAVDKPLDAKARAAVSRLSRRVRPTARRASFVYHGDGYDIPGGWEPLMLKHYDVMYSESYDWWTLAVAFDTADKELVSRLKLYAFEGVDSLGVSIRRRKKRVVVTINCRLHADMLAPNDFGERYDEYDEDDGDEKRNDSATDDHLLGLLTRVRACLMKGQLDPLYAVWEAYGADDEDEEQEATEAPPRPRRTKTGAAVAEELAELLERA
jgi:hypothetical protein